MSMTKVVIMSFDLSEFGEIILCGGVLCNVALVINRVTENSVSTIKFYRVFLKIYER